MKIKHILEDIKALKLKAKWEIACYYDKDSIAPDRIFEYSMKNYADYCEALEVLIRDFDYSKIELSILGQDNEEENVITTQLKTIYLGD